MYVCTSGYGASSVALASLHVTKCLFCRNNKYISIIGTQELYPFNNIHFYLVVCLVS